MPRKPSVFLNVLGTLMLFAGFVLAFLPHASHVSLGLVDEDHTQHVAQGSVLVVMALALLVHNNKALKKWEKRKSAGSNP